MSSPVEIVATAVTALFVPGDRPERFRKAADSGTDLVIIDLEDAVAPADKETARAAVLSALQPEVSGPTLRALVRCNDPDGPWGRHDLAALAQLTSRPGHGLLGVMVPKVGSSETISQVAATLTGSEPLAVVGLVESALGVCRARDIAAAPGVTRLAFGALDFGVDVAAEPDSLTSQLARAQVVIASRAAGLPGPLASPATELNDPEAVTASTRAEVALGFAGRLCIHPRQLAAVRAAFTPTADEVAWAQRVATAGDAAAQVDGQMVDRPVLERARRILRIAGLDQVEVAG